MVKRALVFLVVLATLSLSTGFADVRSFVNRNELYDDESLILTIIVSPQGQLRDEDLAALDSLFVIEQRSQQQITQIINGQRTSQVEYRFRLTPRQIGAIGIPNFRVGNEQSQPIFVTVLDSQDREDSLAEDDVLLTVTPSTNQPYIDQPFTLTIELAYKVQLSGDIANLSLTNFETSILSTDQTQEVRNGRIYNIYRQVVQLVGKNAGEFLIPAIRFNGEYPNQQAGRYERVTRVADVDAINVKPIPAEYPADAYWLPLNNLTLTENLNDRITVDTNEYIDWQVTLTADGLSGRQLPDPLADFEEKVHQNVRIYRDAPTFNEQQRIDHQSISIVSGGGYRIPAIRIPWWNTTEDRLMWIETTEKVINVNQSTTTTGPSSTQPNQTNGNPTIMDDTAIAEPERHSHFGAWLWMLTGVMTLLGLLVMFILRQSKRRRAITPDTGKKIKPVASLIELARSGQLFLLYQQCLKTIEDKDLSLGEAKKQLVQSDIDVFNRLETHLFEESEQAPASTELLTLVKSIMALSKETPNKTASDFQLYPS